MRRLLVTVDAGERVCGACEQRAGWVCRVFRDAEVRTLEYRDGVYWRRPECFAAERSDPVAVYHRGRAEAFQEAADMLNAGEQRVDVWKRLVEAAHREKQEAGR